LSGRGSAIAGLRRGRSVQYGPRGHTKQRKSDLRKIVEFQNAGDITRIYTYAMAAQFEDDLRLLKRDYSL
jgi:hypothetical protein